MEEQLFNWEAWDEAGTGCFTFYKIILKQDIGPYKQGDFFDIAYVDYESGFLQLIRDCNPTTVPAEFELKLVVGDPL